MAARILLFLPEGEPGIGGIPSGVRAALARLVDQGATEAELEASVVETDGASGLPLLHFALHSLARHGALQYRVIGDGGLLVTATASSPLDLREPTADRHYTLSRFALLRRDGDRMVLETSLTGARIIIDDERALAILMPRRPSGLSTDESSALRTLFLACSMLAEDAEDEGALAYWSFNDLLFHARTRLGRHHGEYGGSYPFRDRIESPPVVKKPMSNDLTAFSKPELEGEFTSIVEKRHTSRDFGDLPITRQQLGEFLYRAAGIRATFDGGSGQQLSRRPYPGAGAVYGLEIYATVRDCAGLEPGLYHYCPLENRLERIGEVSEALLRQATQPPHGAPQVLLTITARVGRIFWKYESIGYAVILKDVGALMQTFYLVAEAMALGACALGGGDSDVFAAASGLDYYAETSVGEFVIGSRAEKDT